MMTLDELNRRIAGCRRCPRLVRYRKEVAERPPRRYAGEKYWARPLPGFGDRKASILVIGLAPAAHGGNRTGRMFTGDGSARTLMRSLFANGLSNKPDSVSRDDGLELYNVYLTAALRCAPPRNKPLMEELKRCFDYLLLEFALLPNVKVIVALGRIAFDAAIKLLKKNGYRCSDNAPSFGHSKVYRFERAEGLRREIYLIASYHPSRQNTQTGRLTQEMLDDVFRRALELSIEEQVRVDDGPLRQK